MTPTLPLGGGQEPMVIEGCIYDENNGKLLPGGVITAGGTAVTIVIDDGSDDGCYAIRVLAVGTVVVQLSNPFDYADSMTCTPFMSEFNPSGLPSPCVDVAGMCRLGSDPAGSQLADFTCANNPFFDRFVIELDTPPGVLNNNFPLRQLKLDHLAPAVSGAGYVFLIALLLAVAALGLARGQMSQAPAAGARRQRPGPTQR